MVENLAAFLTGILFWTGASAVLGVAEPWDAAGYWWAYLCVLVLSAAFGLFARSAAWVSGALLVSAQMPVMLAQSGVGPLVVVGVLYLALLSLPAALLAMGAARLRRS